MKEKTKVDKINELIHAQTDSDDSDADAYNNVRIENFDEAEYELPTSSRSEFRKNNANLFSQSALLQNKRYKGKISARNHNPYSDDSDSESSEPNNENSSDEESQEVVANDEEDEDEWEEESIENRSDSEDASDISETTEVDNTSNDKQRAEILKGNCVQNQLRVWERLLELRIHMQKLLTKSNQLPCTKNEMLPNNKSPIATKTTEDICQLLQSLLQLKSSLISQFPELNTHMKSSLKNNALFNDPTNYEPPFKRIALGLEEQHNLFRSYRNTVLVKWDDRTKLLTPGAGAKRKMHEDFDVVRKIENALLNRDVLIKKSQVIQNPTVTPTDEDEEETSMDNAPSIRNIDVYDDSDFYHQQLRELIEYKTNNSSTAADVAKQIVELQKIRQKTKRPVDTRASKGRKVRYIVHKKLVNFMAPDDTASSTWTDESKDELYKSLFAT